MAAGGEVMMVARGMTPAHRHLRSRLTVLLVASVALDVVAAALVYLFERHAPGTGIATPGDALFWTSTQLLTVSSQLPNPISAPARMLDVVLQAYAISVVAILPARSGRSSTAARCTTRMRRRWARHPGAGEAFPDLADVLRPVPPGRSFTAVFRLDVAAA